MARDRPEPKAPAPTSLDAETRVHDDHHVSLRLWLRLLSCTNQIESRVRQNLQSSFNTTLPRFDLMAQLERNLQRAAQMQSAAAPAKPVDEIIE